MTRSTLLDRLGVVETLARGGKLLRWKARPFGYPLAMLHRHLLYPHRRRGLRVDGTTFFGDTMQLFLPSSMDIYLTGGKTHESELRLARYLITTLQAGDVFIDVGAHYGYYSLLAARLVGRQGRVIAIEASPTSYGILQHNLAGIPGTVAKNVAASARVGTLRFYEFPNLYAEYNSFDVTQYAEETWFAENPPVVTMVPTTALDEVVSHHHISPAIVKIDVEGAEERVITGAESLLERGAPVIVMEYLADNRQNGNHRRAENRLLKHNYTPHRIDAEGRPLPVSDVPAYLALRNLESDNIVFQKGW